MVKNNTGKVSKNLWIEIIPIAIRTLYYKAKVKTGMKK